MVGSDLGVEGDSGDEVEDDSEADEEVEDDKNCGAEVIVWSESELESDSSADSSSIEGRADDDGSDSADDIG